MSECAFCRIARGGEEDRVVLQDEVSVAFLDQRPVFHGHALLIPREHHETLMDLPPGLLAALFSNAQVLAVAMEEGLGAEGTFVAVNNRVSQSVPHMHVHVVPRRRGDGLRGFFWPRHPYESEDQIEEVVRALRGAVSRIVAAREG